MDIESKEVKADHSDDEGSVKGALLPLLVVAALILVAIYYGKPMMERFTGSLGETKELEGETAGGVVETPKAKVDARVLMNDDSLAIFVPLLEQVLSEIEGGEVELIYLGLHDEHDDVVVDYRVVGEEKKKEIEMSRDGYGRFSLMAGEGKVLRMIYPPEGFEGFRK